MTALLVVVIFVALIVVHELGHFIVAKFTGVKVEEFGVGYPPRALSLGTWGETEYTINWLPFGGFVRLYGDDDGTVQRGPGSLHRAHRGVQAAILVAGVAMNALLAWVLFAWALHLGVPAVVHEAHAGETVQLYVSDVVPGSPAAAAGLTMGDEILSLSDANGNAPALTPDAFVEFVGSRAGLPLTLEFVHAGATTSAMVRPANAVVPGEAGRPALGVGLALVATRSLPWGEALVSATSLTGQYFAATFQGVWQLIAGSFTLSAPIQDVVGPVGLVSIIGQAAHNGLGNVIKLAGFISVNLAIINLIPIPALDGGRLALLAVEAVLRRPAPRFAVQVINTFGVALIMLLMVVVTYHDIARLLA